MKRQHQVLTLAALAAFCLVATVGTQSAGARACATTGAGTACGHGAQYLGSMSATLETGTSITLTSGFMNVTCSNSTINGELVSNSGIGATGWITEFTLSSCSNNFGQSCTWRTSASTANKWHIEAITGTIPNGHLIISNLTFINTCGTSTCHYKAEKSASLKKLPSPAASRRHSKLKKSFSKERQSPETARCAPTRSAGRAPTM
jgi:hypothetical protein